MRTDTARLLISCPDATGVVASVASFLAEHRGNILEADQHTDPDSRSFFMRIEFETAALDVDAAGFARAFGPIAERFGMAARTVWPGAPARVAILCSKQTHCAADLLWRLHNRELRATCPLVISNHPDARPFAEGLGVAYHELAVTRETKAAQEARIVELLRAERIDLVVLARYMQVMSPGFVDAFAGRIINIHHSFLPAFAGAKPYHQAFEKGVKLIGATSHYVTAELDEGPIIAQATADVTHRDTVDDLVRKGRDLERVVLARAVRAHTDDKVILHGRRTVVFD